jgi:hypothetical protein
VGLLIGAGLLVSVLWIAPAEAVDLEVANYEIEVVLDPETHRLRASERVRWTNVTDTPTDELWFHLYLNAFASSESTFLKELGRGSLRGWTSGQRKWGWIQIERLVHEDGSDLLPAVEFVRPDDGNEDDFSVVRVALPEVVRPGMAVELEIDFSAQLPWIIARTGYIDDFHLVGQWFPKVGVFEGQRGWNCHQFHAAGEFFADFGNYRVAMTIPQDWVLGATGVEIERTQLGEQQRIVHRAERVHDFAWCTAPSTLMEVVEADFDPGRDVPPLWLEQARGLLGLSAADLELPPIKLRLMVPRAQQALTERMLNAARLGVAWFGLYYGPYPYPVLTVVSPPPQAAEAGGMEYPTFVTTRAKAMLAYPPFSWSADIEVVTVHEIGHQYFQGLLASNEFEQGWLDEGTNTYAEYSCMTAVAEQGLVPELRRFVPYWTQERLAIAWPSLPITIDRRAWTYRHRWQYYFASYAKTGVVLRTLEGLIGAEAMARGMRTFFERYSFQHPTGADLEATLSEVAGEDLGWFFDQAVRSDATPDWAVLAVRHSEVQEADGHSWDGAAWQTIGDDVAAAGDEPATDDPTWSIAVELARRGDFTGPVTVELTWENGANERRSWDSETRWTRWRFRKNQRLTQVVIDPDGSWALETRRADNYWRDTPDTEDEPLWWGRGALRALGQVILRWGW